MAWHTHKLSIFGTTRSRDLCLSHPSKSQFACWFQRALITNGCLSLPTPERYPFMGNNSWRLYSTQWTDPSWSETWYTAQLMLLKWESGSWLVVLCYNRRPPNQLAWNEFCQFNLDPGRKSSCDPQTCCFCSQASILGTNVHEQMWRRQVFRAM